MGYPTRLLTLTNRDKVVILPLMGSEESLLTEVHFIEKQGSQNTAEI